MAGERCAGARRGLAKLGISKFGVRREIDLACPCGRARTSKEPWSGFVRVPLRESIAVGIEEVREESTEVEYGCKRCRKSTTHQKKTRLRDVGRDILLRIERFDADTRRKKRRHISFAEEENLFGEMWKLRGVIVHRGRSADDGHYYAYVGRDGRWFKCNDESVAEVTTTEVLRAQAYVLHYSRK